MIKCWHYRRIISRCADEDTPIPPAAQAHIAECKDCRRRYQTEREIVRGLSIGAPVQKRHEPEPYLASSIMARIASSQPIAGRATMSSLLRWSAALAAVCLALTVMLLRSGRPGPVGGQIVLPQSASHADATPAMNWTNPTNLTEWATHPDQPLETEMDAVIHDARGAMMALADNFFPEQLREMIVEKTASRN